MRNVILFLVLCAAPLVAFGQRTSIDNIYRENGDGSNATIPASQTSSPFPSPFEGVTYTNSTPSSGLNYITHVCCGSGIALEGQDCEDPFDGGGGPAGIVEITPEECQHLIDSAKALDSENKFESAHQAYRKAIETCANTTKVWHLFNSVGGTNSFRSTDINRYIDCREWLKEVLYLSSDTMYYCSDVRVILSTFKYFDSARGTDVNGSQAVLKYLIENNRCPVFTDEFINSWTANREYQLEHWRDTVKDSLVTPLDTTIPTLEDLDLGILRGPNQEAVSATHEPHLGELIATRNPFADVLELKYRLAKSGMVRIDVYDLLGRSVYSEGQGYKQDGEYMLSLQSKPWSSGSYYVRLSTPSGEVKTVKVVKE